MSELSVVLGARGGIGSAVLAELIGRGARVRAVGRSITADQVPAGVEAVAADVGTPQGAAAAVRGAEVVYHCAQPDYTRWSEDFPPLNRAVATATAAEDAKLVVADNLYMYGPGSAPMSESTPQRATDGKGTLRRDMAAELLAAHAAGDLRVTLGRASDYFGPHGVDSALGETFFGRLVAGRKARWLGSLDQPHALSYLPDVGRGLVSLGENAAADGRPWHLPAASATGRELLGLASAALGREAHASAAPPWLLRTLGLVNPMMRELAGIAHQWTGPWEIDGSAYEKAFGPLPVTPLEQAVAETVAWWRAHG
ncbi:MAG TPA: NAD-dependent epimerase/dehydratase family protein [Jiangellales bacterium]|nr:NAD-dependent epimerase/dehydratase family protein [Jiangellales bacterium]